MVSPGSFTIDWGRAVLQHRNLPRIEVSYRGQPFPSRAPCLPTMAKTALRRHGGNVPPLPTPKFDGRPQSRPGQSADWPACGRRRKPTPGLDGGRTANYALWVGGTPPTAGLFSRSVKGKTCLKSGQFPGGGVLGAVPLTSGILLSKFRTCCDSDAKGAAVRPLGADC